MKNNRFDTSQPSNSGGGVGVLTVLTIVFVVLKVIPGTAVNDWSWWWVLSPLWIPTALVLGIFFIAALYYIIVKHDWK